MAATAAGNPARAAIAALAAAGAGGPRAERAVARSAPAAPAAGAVGADRSGGPVPTHPGRSGRREVVGSGAAVVARPARPARPADLAILRGRGVVRVARVVGTGRAESAARGTEARVAVVAVLAVVGLLTTGPASAPVESVPELNDARAGARVVAGGSGPARRDVLGVAGRAGRRLEGLEGSLGLEPAAPGPAVAVAWISANSEPLVARMPYALDPPPRVPLSVTYWNTTSVAPASSAVCGWPLKVVGVPEVRAHVPCW